MNVDFELALSRLAEDPTDLVLWSIVLDAFQNKVSNTRTINGNPLTSDIILLLASDDFVNQGTTTTLLHGNAAGNPSWGSVVTNDITNSNVTYNKIQNVSNTSRLLGRITAGAGILEELTGTQATTLLDLFSTVATTKGVVPGSNGVGASYFLRADGTWAIPAGSNHASLANLDYASAGHTGFEPEITAGTNLQYWRGDKTWQLISGLVGGLIHNDLGGLQGGSLTERYHLSATTNTIVTGAPIVAITTATADAVPTGLTCSDTGISIGLDGSESAYVELTWDAIVTTTFDHYRIRYKKTAFTYYTYLDSSTNTIIIEGLTPNTSYDFGVASVNKYGTESAFCADITQVTASDTDPPATVTSGSALAGIQYVIVEWTSNTESDLASYNIYRNTVNNSGTSSLIGNVMTNYFLDGGRTGGQAYYYWIKAVDTSGNESTNFSTEVHATPRNVVSADTNIAHQGWDQTCVFTATDADTVSWGAGSFITSDGTTYAISAGNTGNMAAKTYIYFSTASPTVYLTTTTASTAVGDGKVMIAIAQNHATKTEATYVVMNDGSMHIDANDIVANSITASLIEAGTISATEIDTDSITSLANLSIAASQVLIDGAVYLSNWRHGSDVTKIDGGDIYTGSITTTQLNFTPATSTNVIATINASAEGIDIDADNISISGSTSFSAGYNPYTKAATFAQAGIPTSISAGDIWVDTDDNNKMYRAAIVGADQITAGEWEAVPDGYKLDATGGSYDSSAGTARVRIFPDANTGIQVIDDGGADVFKTIIGGTHVGDVYFGDYAGGNGIFYDKSESTTHFTGTVTAGAGAIGGWTVDSDSIYHGTEQTGNGYAADGLTLHDDGSLHASKFYINADGTVMAANMDLSHLIPKTSSANVRHSDDGEESLSSTSWANIKEFTFTNGLLGQITVTFDLKKIEVGGPGDAFGRIYKNGIAYGTQRTAGLAYQDFPENFTYDWEPGDTCELWVYSASGVDVYVRNFRIMYDNDVDSLIVVDVT